MHYQKNHKYNNKKLHFPLTIRGLSFLLLSLILLFIGFNRGELVAALVGTLLIVYMLVSFILCIISIPIWNKTSVFGSWNKTNSFSLSIMNYPIFFLRLFCSQRILLSFLQANTSVNTKQWNLTIPIVSNESIHQIKSPRRGVFSVNKSFLILEDYARFFSFRLTKPASLCTETVIFPAVPKSYRSTKAVSGSTGQSKGKSTFKRSENLYETRVYIPGDDPRKINWKVYAHSQTLTVREGELLPPPSAELVCLFNIKTIYLPSSELQAMFTELINRSATFLLEHLRNNHIISFIIPSLQNSHDIFRFDNRERNCSTQFLEALALPALSLEGPALESFLPSVPSGATVLIISLPETIPSLKLRKNTFFFTGPFPQPEKKQSFSKRLQQYLFLPDQNQEPPVRTYSQPEFIAWIESLSQEGFRAYIL